jgi:hypothetical protein
MLTDKEENKYYKLPISKKMRKATISRPLKSQQEIFSQYFLRPLTL